MSKPADKYPENAMPRIITPTIIREGLVKFIIYSTGVAELELEF